MAHILASTVIKVTMDLMTNCSLNNVPVGQGETPQQAKEKAYTSLRLLGSEASAAFNAEARFPGARASSPLMEIKDTNVDFLRSLVLAHQKELSEAQVDLKKELEELGQIVAQKATN